MKARILLGSKRAIRSAEEADRKSRQFQQRLSRLATGARSLSSVYQLDAILSRDIPDPVQRSEMRKLLIQFMQPEALDRV